MSIYRNLSYFVIFLISANFHFGKIVALSAERNQNYTYLITGGYRPPEHTLAKHIVSLQVIYTEAYFGQTHICGGSILRPHVVLTAAHCVQKGLFIRKPYTLRVVARTPNRLVSTEDTQVIGVRKVVPHPYYNSDTFANDIAILILKEDIIEDNVLAERIVPPEYSVIAGTKCTVIGWGRIFYLGPLAADAMYVDVEILPFRECEHWYPVQSGMMCAFDPVDKYKDSCEGDSGGPLICGGEIAGVVSFGYQCAQGAPGFYTDTWYYRDWIYKNRAQALISTYVGVILVSLFVHLLLNQYIYSMYF